MSGEDLLGLWYCALIDQIQSEEEEQEFGEYDDNFDRPPQKAGKTDFAETTLELLADGSYRLQSMDWACSHGTWTASEDAFVLTEDDGSSNGFERLESSHRDGEHLVVAFKLVPDAHDGLDVLVLSFGRNPPVARPEGTIARANALADDDDVYSLIDAHEADPAALARELWDAWVAGALLLDPDTETFDFQLQLLGSDALRESGGFGHGHAKHALIHLRPEQDRELLELVLELLPCLPIDDDADAELAPLVTTPWREPAG